VGGEYDLMGGHKTLTIGVTVNLDHYENLRLEVSGEVDSPEDAENLSRFLDTILGSFGRNDPATAERVNSYRRRVLPGPAGKVEAGIGAVESPPRPPDDNKENMPDIVQIASEIPRVSAPVPALSAPPGAIPVVTCASCGAPVSPAEQKMSQLFTSRTLCRVCMKNL
jgi:hypothetical protein